MNTIPVAGFWRRLFALVYDGLILIALLMVAAGVAMLLVELFVPGLNSRNPDALRHHPLYLLWLLLWWFGYYGWCWRRGGQTVGMKAWRLKLVSLRQPELSWRQCLLRFATGLLGLGLLIGLIHPKRSTLQDLASDTQTLLLPKERNV